MGFDPIEIILRGISLLLVLIGFSGLIASYWARHWLKVKCRVQLKRIEEIEVDGKKSYYPVIRYSYIFNGRDYESASFSLMGNAPFSDRRKLQEVLDKIDSVFVCPLFPSMCYVFLDRNIILISALGTGIGLLFLTSFYLMK